MSGYRLRRAQQRHAADSRHSAALINLVLALAADARRWAATVK